MGFFDTTLRLKGFDIAAAKALLREVQSYDQPAFDKYAFDKRNDIFEHHRRQNPWYKHFLKDKKIDCWEQVPVLSKSNIQVGLGQILSSGYHTGNVYLNNTSGSTGQPFHFAKDKFAHAMTWAVIMDRFGRHGIDFNHSLQARFFGIPLTRKKYYIEQVKDRLSNRVRFPVFDLSDNILETYLQRFYKKKFEYLNGYTSSLVLFAKYVAGRNMVLKDICPTLKVCVTTSEICSLQDRQILEKGFGIKVVNEYGAAELDLLAFEDENFNWIMNNENLFFEILDEENNVLPFGSEGRMVVTALHNRAMPFIRYTLGDICVISEKRVGNNFVLDSLVGRTNDIATLPSGKRSPGLTFYYISKSLMEDGGFMKEFVIKQTRPEHFVFEYVAERNISQQQEEKVKEMMNLYLEPGLTATFKKVDKIERTKAGKFKHFQTNVK